MTKYEIRETLITAAREGQLDQVPKEILTQQNMRLKDEYGWTPLHRAAECGHLDQVPAELLTQENMTLVDVFGKTPLYWAAEKGHLDQLPKGQFPEVNLNKCLDLIQAITSADVIVVDDSPLLHGCDSASLTGDPENEVLYFSWVDSEEEYGAKFTEGALSCADVEGNAIHLIDSEGERSTISLFEMVPSGICID